MRPLRIEAHLAGPVMLPGGPPAIDAMLVAAVAIREQLPPALTASECVPIEIPIARAPGGRFHLASFGSYRCEETELRYLNRKFPLAEAQAMGNEKLKRIELAGGPTKSFRIPGEAQHLVGDTITWWAIGDVGPVRKLLDLIPYVGKKRSVGLGKVREWRVEPCEPWGEGFPIIAPDGKPTRPVPSDWPGLVEPALAHRVLTYPYWDHAREELCAVPDAAA